MIDGAGKFLMPALWDMHVHLLYPERLDTVLPLLVAAGVLGIRDMGSTMPAADVQRMRAEIADEAKRKGLSFARADLDRLLSKAEQSANGQQAP